MRFKGLSVLALVAAGCVCHALTYHVTILQGFGVPSRDVTALSVNSQGWVVGWAIAPSGWGHAFVDDGFSCIDLGTMGGRESIAWAVNAAGQVAGGSQTATGLCAFLYSDGVIIDLGNFGGASSQAYGINDLGQAVGCSQLPDSDNRAFLYSNGALINLGTLGGDGYSEAYDINNSGQIVGVSTGEIGGLYAFLYENGTMTSLGTLGGSTSHANAINAFGEVVGYSQVKSGLTHPFLYTGGVMKDMLPSTSGGEGRAEDINDAGQVVANTPSPKMISGAQSIDLYSSLDASGTNLYMKSAHAIANNGMIVGRAYSPSASRELAVLLTPNAGFSGAVALQNYSGSVTQVPVTIQIRKAGTTDVVQTQTVYPNANGSYSFCSSLMGNYDLVAKGSHWLRKKIASMNVTGDGYMTGLNLSLINGDVNGDNSINLADLTAISRAWRSTPGSPTWNPNADLNGDGAVNLADWTIVSRNWRLSGDL